MVLILLKDMGAENRNARGDMPVIAHTHVHRDKRGSRTIRQSEGRIVAVFLKEYAGSRMIARLTVMRLSEMTPEDQSG